MGMCQLSCQDTLLDCEGRCIDPGSSEAFCGASGDCTGPEAGEVCGGGRVCTGGVCEVTCLPGLLACDEACIDPLTDERFCGATNTCSGADAGEVCDAREACDSGICTVIQLAWTERNSPVTPRARARPAVAYDPDAQEILLFGGDFNDQANNRGDDLWAWTGSSWSLRTPGTTRPLGRGGSASAFDRSRGVMVVYGGTETQDFTALTDTWEWDGVAWRDATPASGTQPRLNNPSGAMVFVRTSSVSLLYQGRDQETWEWDGTTWSDVSPLMGNPSERNAPQLAYDAKRDRVVLFGGISRANGSVLNDTWEWDGSSWNDVTPPTGMSPGARKSGRVAYDSTRKRVLLFGGFVGNSIVSLTLLSDLWAWDGSTWVEITPAISPPGRSSMGLAYDEQRDELLMFGGAGTALSRASVFSDTWTFGP